MTDKIIEYKSVSKIVNGVEQVLDSSDQNDIKCVWRGVVVPAKSNSIEFKWIFDLEDKEDQELKSVTGQIVVRDMNSCFSPFEVDVDVSKDDNTVVGTTGSGFSAYSVTFEYKLTPHYVPISKISYVDLFAPSDFTDVILVVEEKKLHFNKTFLSMHSDYFRALFSSNFKEGQLNEIEIKDVAYEDFGLFMSSFYPKAVFPNDRTVEKLLEFARRFLVPAVISTAEYHLMYNSRIPDERMLWLADEYGMEKRLDRSIRQLNTLDKAKNLKNAPEFVKLSDKARSQILARLMNLI